MKRVLSLTAALILLLSLVVISSEPERWRPILGWLGSPAGKALQALIVAALLIFFGGYLRRRSERQSAKWREHLQLLKTDLRLDRPGLPAVPEQELGRFADAVSLANELAEGGHPAAGAIGLRASLDRARKVEQPWAPPLCEAYERALVQFVERWRSNE